MKIDVYTRSVIKKIEYFFYNKSILELYRLFDEENQEIDNVLYLKTNENFIGIYIKGENPFFSDFSIQELDIFNLYETYQNLEYAKEKLLIKINDYKLVFNSEYNELLGIYLKDNEKISSFCIIFQFDNIITRKNIPFNVYLDILKSNLLHINDIRIYEKCSNMGNG